MDLWQILEIAGTAVGLVYLWLEYKANVWLWLAGIIMPAIYIYVYYKSGFYADMGINIYYLIAGLYGWAVWLGKSHKSQKVRTMNGGETFNGVMSAGDGDRTGGGASAENHTENQMPITRIPRRQWLPLTLVAAAFFVPIAWILINFTDSTVPYGDSFTTALSIVGMWMLARKYAEQWLVWIAVDVVCCGLYLYKGLWFTGCLYGLYAVIAVFGYMKWVRMAEK